MSSEIVPTDPTRSLPAESIKTLLEYQGASIAPATLRVYRAGLRDFVGWCEGMGLPPMPASPVTVAAYATVLADDGKSVSTIEQRMAAIRWAHDAKDLSPPTASKIVRSTLSGIRRKVGIAPKRQAAPATVERVTAMLSHVQGDGIKAIRDRAILLLGFASAMRRSELVALQIEDIETRDDGLLLTVRRSKTDQEGAGVTIAVPRGLSASTCPVQAVSLWIERAGLETGPLFRSVTRHGHIGDALSARAVSELVKGAARKAGFDGDFSGHSLRAGFVTSAAERGVRAEAISDHTRHASVEMVRRYTRKADLFKAHPGEGML